MTLREFFRVIKASSRLYGTTKMSKRLKSLRAAKSVYYHSMPCAIVHYYLSIYAFDSSTYDMFETMKPFGP